MARKKAVQEDAVVEETSTEAQSEVETPEVEAPDIEEMSYEARLIDNAFQNDDPLGALKNIIDNPETEEVFKTVIGTYLALLSALGDDSPATQHALENMKTFKPAKKKKAKKAPKPKKFNEVKALRDALSNEEDEDFESVKALLDHDEVSEDLKVAITTYFTLKDLEGVDEMVISSAYNNLVNFGRKRKGAPRNRATFHVDMDGVKYANLSTAIHLNYSDDKNDKGQKECDIAWRLIRTALLKGEAIELDDRTYTPVEPSDESVPVVRKKKEEVTEEAEEAETAAEE